MILAVSKLRRNTRKRLAICERSVLCCETTTASQLEGTGKREEGEERGSGRREGGITCFLAMLRQFD